MNAVQSPTAGDKEKARLAIASAVRAGRIQHPATCEKCDREVPVQGHHPDYSKPLEVEWLCIDCHAETHRTEPSWVADARQHRAEGKTYGEIAALVGMSQGAVWKRLNPETVAAINKRENAMRREEKAAWRRANRRRPSVRGTCNSCGELRGFGIRSDGLCSKCHFEKKAAEDEAKARKVEVWWAEGRSQKYIEAQLGLSNGALGTSVLRWRRKGFDLPYRRPGRRAAQ